MDLQPPPARQVLQQHTKPPTLTGTSLLKWKQGTYAELLLYLSCGLQGPPLDFKPTTHLTQKKKGSAFFAH